MFFGELGDDSFVGGDGFDTVDFTNSGSYVYVDLYSQVALNDGFGGYDQLTSIERVVGSAYNDLLFASLAGSTLEGGAGDDSVYGGSGVDLLAGGLGNDAINGGGGDSDIVTFAGAGNAVVVDLESSLASGEGDDTLTNIDDIIGSNFNDFLAGDTGANVIEGGSGNDTLAGGGGSDELHGGGGNDTLDGGLGDDNLYGDNNNDVLFGDSGYDVIDGGSGNDSLFGEDDDDTLDGGIGNDTLNGGAGNDVLDGGTGNDIIEGYSGDDVIVSALGDDTISGGDGFDTFSFENATEAVDVDLFLGTIANDGFGDSDTVSEIEAVIGSGFDDLLIGDAGNFLDGGAGNDTLIGSNGEDILLGGDGNDILSGASGRDSLDGGAGNDEIDIGRLSLIEGGLGDDIFNFEALGDAAIVTDVGGNDTLFFETGSIGLLTINPVAFLMFIEEGNLFVESALDEDANVVTVEDFAATTSIESFVFESVGSTPFLFAAAGTTGNDLLIGLESTLTLAGGDGNDIVQAGDSDVVNLTGGDGDDFIIGSEEIVNTLDGGIGNDVLSALGGVGGEGNLLLGGSGNDILIAGETDTVLQGGADDDTYVFTFTDQTTSNTITDSSGTDTLLLNSGIDFPTSISISGGVLSISFDQPSGGTTFITVFNQTTNGIEFVTADLGRKCHHLHRAKRNHRNHRQRHPNRRGHQ